MAPQLSLALVNKMASTLTYAIYIQEKKEALGPPHGRAGGRNEEEGRSTRQLTVKRPVNDWAQMV